MEAVHEISDKHRIKSALFSILEDPAESTVHRLNAASLLMTMCTPPPWEQQLAHMKGLRRQKEEDEAIAESMRKEHTLGQIGIRRQEEHE